MVELVSYLFLLVLVHYLQEEEAVLQMAVVAVAEAPEMVLLATHLQLPHRKEILEEMGFLSLAPTEYAVAVVEQQQLVVRGQVVLLVAVAMGLHHQFLGHRQHTLVAVADRVKAVHPVLVALVAVLLVQLDTLMLHRQLLIQVAVEAVLMPVTLPALAAPAS